MRNSRFSIKVFRWILHRRLEVCVFYTLDMLDLSAMMVHCLLMSIFATHRKLPFEIHMLFGRDDLTDAA